MPGSTTQNDDAPLPGDDVLTDKPTAAAAPRRASRRANRTTPQVRRAVWGITALAALAAQVSSASPTGLEVADRLWVAALAACVAYLSSRATRAACLWMAAIATIGAIGSAPAAVIGGIGLALAASTAFHDTRRRVAGALIGLASATALLLLPDLGPHGASGLVVAVAVLPVLKSGYVNSPRTEKRRMRRILGWTLGAVTVASLVAVGVAVLSVVALTRGVDESRAGLSAAGDGDQEAASVRFQSAESSFDDARNWLSGPWMWPARLVPVVSQHVDAASGAAASGYDLAEAAGEAASAAPYRELKAEDGGLDLGQLEAMQAPVRTARTTLEQAAADLDDALSPWLVAPLSDAIDRFRGEVDDALPDARLADDALQVAPGLLGGDGDRRYLVLFTTPAESRNLGGFVGSYAVLTASGGDVDLEESGSIDELNQQGSAGRTITGNDEYLKRYGRYRIERFVQNVTASPDMRSVSEVAASLFEQSTGDPVDGVVVADPYALAAMLELTGPIDVPSVGFSLNSENVANYLLRDQYVLYEEADELRRDRLQDVGRATFDALTQRPLPGPNSIGAALGPVVDQKRLLFYPLDRAARGFMSDIGATGELSAPEGSDLMSVRMSNLRANKIDVFASRTVRYDVDYDAATERVRGTVTVSVRNDAPTAGLPAYVIGSPTSRYPQGTNRTMLSVFTPLLAQSVQLDGAPVGVESQVERGLNVYAVPVEIPAGGAVTLTFELEGTIEGMGDTYRLLASNQPLVNPDQLTVSVRGGGAEVASATGVDVVGGGAERGGEWATDRRISVRFG